MKYCNCKSKIPNLYFGDRVQFAKCRNESAKIVAVGGICLSVLASIVAWQWDTEKLQNFIHEDSDNLKRALEETIDDKNVISSAIDELKTREILNATLPGQTLDKFNIYLYTTSLDGEIRPLVFYEPKTHTYVDVSQHQPKLAGRGWLCPEFSPISTSSGGKAFGKLRRTHLLAKPCTREVKIGTDTYFSLLLLPTSDYFAAHKYWRTWSVLGGGLVLTSILTSYLLALQRYTNRVEAQVEERTGELQESNERLQQTNSQLQQTLKEIRLLNEMNDGLLACYTLEQAYAIISLYMEQLFPDFPGGIFAISESKNFLEEMSSWGEGSSIQKLFCPHDCMALRMGQPSVLGSDRCGALCKNVNRPHPSQHCCIPMAAQGETIGLLHLSSPEGAKLTQSKQELGTTVAKQVALSLANLKLRESLQHQSIRDPLTNLFNRRYMETCLERELRRAQLGGLPLGILMLDLDRFKQFNDTFGHDAGDTVLREIGLFLQKQIRGSDIACRYGGEEITLILPDTPLDVCRSRAEQIREGVKHLNIQHRGQSLGVVSFSIGVATFPEHGLTGEAVVEAADAALYRAKREGRDRVICASINAIANTS
ncbi:MULTISPECIES: sensor domain-containing diguanylate cyclase [Limnospira]|uniref:Diguanylate cyclase n=1 Tax=Limnospira maxima CS-328 TaxID=513049 RepID=B5W7A8_LIMMA|nr:MULTISPECIES: diguanylate cyclase [Limnospira]EKD06855.1 diguanylate cyclase [Arthrospira platensis C1]MDC0840151.1 diguanylate cyclase [Limnoraphis robusta]MDY7054669.1 diguanylate cyclase [Limnospira fusiformis LS22]QJB26339.1 diguanylate cyclase [Limnospira fusiformis SAG 85.79]EDZ92595.1 diguanylate cyclase [Limnospira maxima CS-328]